MHLSEIKVSTTEISGLVYLLYINHFCFTSYFSSVIHAPPAVALDPLPPPPTSLRTAGLQEVSCNAVNTMCRHVQGLIHTVFLKCNRYVFFYKYALRCQFAKKSVNKQNVFSIVLWSVLIVHTL